MRIKLSELKKIIREETRPLNEAALSGEDLQEQINEKFGELNQKLYEELNALAQSKLVGREVWFRGTGRSAEYEGIVANISVTRDYDDPTSVSITLSDGHEVPRVSLWTLEVTEKGANDEG